MKKMIMVILSALLLLSLAACSSPSGSGDAPAPSQAAASPSGDANASEDGAPSGDAESGEELFGKVKSMVGNELTLDLAKTPEEGFAGMIAGGGEDLPGGGSISVTTADSAEVPGEDSDTESADSDSADGSSGDSSKQSTVIAFEGENGEAHVISPGDMPKTELEYTGESKDLTIPTGLPITDLFGNELKPSDLKEGNVLMASLGADGAITSILVLE